MITDCKIRDEKLQYDIYWEAAKISVLSFKNGFNINRDGVPLKKQK